MGRGMEIPNLLPRQKWNFGERGVEGREVSKQTPNRVRTRQPYLTHFNPCLHREVIWAGSGCTSQSQKGPCPDACSGYIIVLMRVHVFAGF